MNNEITFYHEGLYLFPEGIKSEPFRTNKTDNERKAMKLSPTGESIFRLDSLNAIAQRAEELGFVIKITTTTTN